MREKETNAAVRSASIPDELVANREYKDSVFRNLFSDKNYMYQLYKVLHPEEKRRLMCTGRRVRQWKRPSITVCPMIY